MSIEHDITYKWVNGSGTITKTRQLVNAADAALDLAVPASVNKYPSAFALTLAKAQSIVMVCDQAVTMYNNGTNAVQTLSITGTPTGGTFTITCLAQTTAAVAYNAAASAVQAALRLLSNVTADGVTCTGGPLPGTPVVCTFAGTVGLRSVTTMTTTDSLTGGSAPATAVAVNTAGVVPDTTVVMVAGLPLVWDSAGYFAQPFAADVTKLSFTNASGSQANFQARTLSSQ